MLRLATLAISAALSRSSSDHLERALERARRDQQDVAATIFDHLVTPSGTKIAHRAATLRATRRSGAEVVAAARCARSRADRASSRRSRGRRALRDLPRRPRRRRPRLARPPRRRARSRGSPSAAAPPRRSRCSCARRAGSDDCGRRLRPDGTLTCAQCGSPGAGTCPRSEIPLGIQTKPERGLADAVAAAQSDPGARAEGVLRQALVTNHESAACFATPGRYRWWPLRRAAAGCSPREQTSGLRVYSRGADAGADLARGPQPPSRRRPFRLTEHWCSAPGGREAILWRAATGERRHTLHLPGAVSSAVFSPRRPRPAHHHRARWVALWRTDTGHRVAHARGREQRRRAPSRPTVAW